jgi:hypothetical protein
MHALNDETGIYQLPLNTLIQAKVSATNGQGDGEYSEQNVAGTLIQTIPQAPPLVPLRVEDQSTTDSIAIQMPEISSFTDLSGGSEITSYNLESNQGSGSVFSEYTGQTVEQLSQLIIVPTAPGLTYLFRYRVKNMFGFSVEYSPGAELKSAKAPETPMDAATSIAGKNVLIEWTPDSDNYDTVTRYEVELRDRDGVWNESTLTCDGANEQIKTDAECLIPLLTLISTDFNLQ